MTRSPGIDLTADAIGHESAHAAKSEEILRVSLGLFAHKGFRPIEGSGVEVDEVEGAEDPSDPFPTPEKLLTVEETFGDFAEISDTFFNEDTGTITQIIAQTGKGE